jgi:hypothetical protein
VKTMNRQANRQLKRIEQTLQKLEKQSQQQSATAVQPSSSLSSPTTIPIQATPLPSSQSPKPTTEPAPKAVSFELNRRTPSANPTGKLEIETSLLDQVTPITTHNKAVQPLVVEPSPEESTHAKFQLPDFNQQPVSNLGFSSHRNGSNPDVAINLLRDTLGRVEAWRQELTQIGQQIQAIYLEGPIVDGWLECSTQKVEDTTHVLRHGEIDQLMNYVEEICNDPSKAHPEYRLCGLGADGRTWSSPCPPEQIASMSLAISRHQKLKPLLQRKAELENKLGRVAEEIVKLQSRLNAIV